MEGDVGHRAPARKQTCVTGGWVMLSPYGLDVIERCLTCKLRTDRIFCDLETTALQAFESIKFVATYPKGSVLFVEGQTPRGVNACREVRSLGLSHSAGAKLAQLLLECGRTQRRRYQTGAAVEHKADARGDRSNDRTRFGREGARKCSATLSLVPVRQKTEVIHGTGVNH
jgi:hypothetical protein